MIFMVHVPKSGGTSLGKSLRECFAYDSIFTGVTLAKLGWTNGPAGQYIRIAPRDKLNEFELVSAHLTERIRTELYPYDLSIAISRDPRARFISLVRHTLRDYKDKKHGLYRFLKKDGTLEIENADEFRHTYLQISSPFFFVDQPWRMNFKKNWEDEWDRALSESTRNLDNYDLCVTTKNLAFYQEFIREALGAPNFGKAERLNTAEQRGDTTDLASIEKLGNIYDKYLSRENEFFTVFQAKSDTMRIEIEKNRADWLFWMRGRIAKKQIAWKIDWSKRVDALGWSNRELPGDQVYSGRIARLMLGNISSIDMPLQGGLSYKARGVFWTGGNSFEHLKVTVDGEPVAFELTRPHSKIPNMAVLALTFDVPVRAANTRLELDISECENKEVWCLDMSAKLNR